MNRIAWTLDEDGTIEVTPPARYCYAVARFVLFEDTRRREHANVSLSGPRRLDTWALGPSRPNADEEPAQKDRQFDCLDRCVQTLTAAQQTLILDYYRDERRAKIDRRRALAERLGITMKPSPCGPAASATRSKRAWKSAAMDTDRPAHPLSARAALRRGDGTSRRIEHRR